MQSTRSARACAVHILQPENYQKQILKDHKNWNELAQYCHSILCYEVHQLPNITIDDKIRFVEGVESTYKFIHPAIAPTFKYTYSDNFSISYVGDKTSFFSHKFKNKNPTNTQKQIILIAAASALLYLETKGTSLYCLNLDNLIFNKDGNPKFLCAGIPSIFKPKSFSPAQSFGQFAKSLFSEDKIPSSIKSILDQCNSKADCPSLQEIYDFFIAENRFLPNVDSDEIEKYLKWLKFQDKFPCEYFYELSEGQIDELITAISDDGTQSHQELADHLSDGISYPRRDVFGAMYFSDRTEDALICAAYYASPKWFMDLNTRFVHKFVDFDKSKDYFFDINIFPYQKKFSLNEKEQALLRSTDPADVECVINSYLRGRDYFPKAPEQAHQHIKKLLKTTENQTNPFLHVKLGEIYENGIGVIVNYEKSLVHYQMAKCHAKHNEFDIDEKIDRVESKKAELSRQMNNLNEECQNRLEKANNNEFKALMYVAFSFLYGLNGFPLSQLKAKEYYLKASEIDPYVLCMLGNLYRLGIGFPRNIDKAAKLYAKANILNCPRGRAYHGLMMMRDYSPFAFDSETFIRLDKYFFDYKNHQVKSHLFNYCRMIQLSQCHFPIVNNAAYLRFSHPSYKLDGPKTFSRRSIHLPSLYETIEVSFIPGIDDNCMPLNKTEVQISLWFLFYQLVYLSENGHIVEKMYFRVEPFRNKHKFLAITDLSSYHFAKCFPKSLFNEIRLYLHPDMITTIAILFDSDDFSLKGFLEYVEHNQLDPKIDMEAFQEFVRECKNFVPYESAQLLVSDIVEQANSGDSQSIQECAFNYFYGTESFPINYQESFRYYEILAGDPYNNSTAQMWLGIMYSIGIGVNQNYSEALKWFKKSSDQKNIQGRLNYALFLEYYNKNIKDKTDPYIPYCHLLEDCCHTNDKESLFQMGKLRESYSGWEYGRESSIKYYRMAYQLGHIESAKRLYHVYKKLGMKKEQNSILSFLITINDPKYLYLQAQQYYDHEDYDNSIKLTMAIMPTGNKKFTKLYGDHLLNGHKVERNVKLAKKFYISAAETNPLAIQALANIYIEGIDCEPDLEKAESIYLTGIKAISFFNESQLCDLYCQFCEKHGRYEKAFQYYQKIAHDKKTKESQYKVAMSFLNPEHNECKKNIKKGLQYLKLAADQGYPDAEFELGYSYIYGKYGQKRDYEKGLKYLTAASRKDHLEATYLVGKIYYEGIGTIHDTEKSKNFFLKAAKRNHPKAKYYVYLNSDLNVYKKRQYLEESAKEGYPKAQFAYAKLLLSSVFIQPTNPNYAIGIRYLKSAAEKNFSPAQEYLHELTSKNNE